MPLGQNSSILHPGGTTGACLLDLSMQIPIPSYSKALTKHNKPLWDDLVLHEAGLSFAVGSSCVIEVSMMRHLVFLTISILLSRSALSWRVVNVKSARGKRS